MFPRTSSCGGLAARPRVSGASRRGRTCISGRCYRDRVRSGRFQDTLRGTPSLSAAPAARVHFARGQRRPVCAFARTSAGVARSWARRWTAEIRQPVHSLVCAYIVGNRPTFRSALLRASVASTKTSYTRLGSLRLVGNSGGFSRAGGHITGWRMHKICIADYNYLGEDADQV
jgi:hypothetical protein